MSDEQRSDVPHRQKISLRSLVDADNDVHNKMASRLNQKGYGAWLSRHEILGILQEEYIETVDAVHDGELDELKEELIDLAVGCMFGIACINQGTLDW